MSERKFASTSIRDSEDKLGLTPEQVSQLLADANVAKAKTKFMTEVDGGLIYSAILKLYDAGGTGDEMSGISGIAGDNKEDPSFWAGGTYEQAIDGTAKAIIRHDGTVKFTDAEIAGVINALHGKIGNFSIVDGELTANHSYMTYLPNDIYVEVTGDIRITSGGIIISNSYGGTTGHPDVVHWNIEITSVGVKVGDYEIRRDGFYQFGDRIELGAGDYVHPSTHPASMITTGTFAGIVKADNNTSYTTKQVRNMILSANDAISSQMANGDIWIKYE